MKRTRILEVEDTNAMIQCCYMAIRAGAVHPGFAYDMPVRQPRTPQHCMRPVSDKHRLLIRASRGCQCQPGLDARSM